MKRLLLTVLAFFISNFTLIAMELEEWEFIKSSKEKITLLLEKRSSLDVVDFNMFLKRVSKYLDSIRKFEAFMPDLENLKSARIVDDKIAVVKQSMAVLNDIDAKLWILRTWILAKNAQSLYQTIKQETENNFSVLKKEGIQFKGVQFNEQSVYPFLGLTSENAEKMPYKDIKNRIETRKVTAGDKNGKLILRQITYQLGNQFKKRQFDAYLKGPEGIKTLFNEYQKNATGKMVAIQKEQERIIELRENLADLENKLVNRKKSLEVDEYLQETEEYADNAAERIRKMDQRGELEKERAVIREKINQLGVYEKRKLTPFQKNALWGLKNQSLPSLLRIIEDKLIRMGVKR